MQTNKTNDSKYRVTKLHLSTKINSKQISDINMEMPTYKNPRKPR